MQEQLEYEYAFIRFVPKVEREEFINVGVILFCKRKNFLQTKCDVDISRIESFGSDIEIEELKEYLNTWSLIARGNQEGGFIASLDISSRFRWLTAPRSTIIQPSPVRSGLCVDPEDELNDLFQRGVLV